MPPHPLAETLTVEQVRAQLCGVNGWMIYDRTPDGPILNEEGKRWIKLGIGAFYGVLRADPWTGVSLTTGLRPDEGQQLVNQIHDYAREHAPHGIAPFVISEAAHGHMAPFATLGPTQLTASQSWNPDLWERFQTGVSWEAKSAGANVVFAPTADLARDPRWGRCDETAGEDPFLVSAFVKAGVRGLQASGIAAVAKHFIHGTPRAGLNSHTASLGPREFHEVYLRPFRAAIEAGVHGVMPGYNAVDGEPCHASLYLLRTLLRESLGFKGVTFSDVYAVHMLTDPYFLVPDAAAAGNLAVESGVDVDMSNNPTLLHSTEDFPALREAASRVLALKEQLGLLADRGPQPTSPAVNLKEVAHELTRQSLVLLTNPGQLLPLSREVRSIAVIGPNADSVYNLLGDYTPPVDEASVVTISQGVRQCLPGAEVLVAKGCGVKTGIDEEMERALSVARKADLVVLALGGSAARNFEALDPRHPDHGALSMDSAGPDMDCGEGADRCTLALLGRQTELAERILSLGKPTVIVLTGGRPFVLGGLAESAAAILWAGHPGPTGGLAIAETLFGQNNPSGRLTMTWPASEGQLPMFAGSHSLRGSRYVECPAQPAFEFGHGLSYSSFRVEGLSSEVVGNAVRVRFTVRHEGGPAGSHVVPVWLLPVLGPALRPLRSLKGFARVELGVGESRSVEVVIPESEWRVYGPDGRLVAGRTEFEIEVGSERMRVAVG
ncbi:MAG: glycoside hydrolase family 3 C-terminal domain-containing protein [Armatimonadetes bacterium]|nr:glycoside hydrolase family 3 C-terminal domain-containing protein [Armatimonadota bacterium]